MTAWALSPDHGQAETGEKCETDDVQRAEVEGAVTVQTFGAVMHLMEGAPEPVDPVHGPVPGVDQQLIKQHADAGPDEGIECFQVEELVLGQRVAPEQGQVGR